MNATDHQKLMELAALADRLVNKHEYGADQQAADREEAARQLSLMATMEARIEEWWSACALVMENYSFITGRSREPVTTAMQRPENDERVFRLVISLNNLRKQFADMESFMREHGIKLERPQ